MIGLVSIVVPEPLSSSLLLLLPLPVAPEKDPLLLAMPLLLPDEVPVPVELAELLPEPPPDVLPAPPMEVCPPPARPPAGPRSAVAGTWVCGVAAAASAC